MQAYGGRLRLVEASGVCWRWMIPAVRGTRSMTCSLNGLLSPFLTHLCKEAGSRHPGGYCLCGGRHICGSARHGFLRRRAGAYHLARGGAGLPGERWSKRCVVLVALGTAIVSALGIGRSAGISGSRRTRRLGNLRWDVCIGDRAHLNGSLLCSRPQPFSIWNVLGSQDRACGRWRSLRGSFVDDLCAL